MVFIRGKLRASFSFVNRNLLVYIIIHIVRQLSMFITQHYFSLYVLALGGTAASIGLVSALRSLASLFMYPIAGYLADSRSRVKLIGVTGYIHASLWLFYIFAREWSTLAVVNFLQGLLIFSHPAFSALMADSLPPEQRGTGFAAMTAIPGAVGILSPYIGGYLITKYGIDAAMRYLYAHSVICSILIATINIRFLKETLKKFELTVPLRNIPLLLKESYRSVWEAFRWMPKSLRFLALILMLSIFFNSVAGPFWVVYSITVIKLTALEWGLIGLLTSGLRFGLMIPAGMIMDRFGKRRMIVVALALSIFPVSFFVFCKNFAETLSVLVVVSIANAFLTPACSALLADIVPRKRRGRIMAVLGRGILFIRTSGGGGGPGMGFVLTIPASIGYLIGGYIFGFNSVFPWFLLSAALAFILILSIMFIPEPKEPEA